jgi:hypothetical protein
MLNILKNEYIDYELQATSFREVSPPLCGVSGCPAMLRVLLDGVALEAWLVSVAPGSKVKGRATLF